jgi:hypothetical protein
LIRARKRISTAARRPASNSRKLPHHSRKHPRAEPEKLCPVQICAGLPRLEGRVNSGAVVSGYINSGFAVALTIRAWRGALFDNRSSSPVLRGVRWDISRKTA